MRWRRAVTPCLLAALAAAACGARTGLEHEPSQPIGGDGATARDLDAGRDPDGAARRDGSPIVDGAFAELDARLPDGAPVPMDAWRADAGPLCATEALRFGAVPPPLVLVVDGSLSMETRFPDEPSSHATRWTTLLALVLGGSLPDGSWTRGLLARYATRIDFGLLVYSDRWLPGCLLETWVAPSPSASAAIESALTTTTPGGRTPTAAAVRRAIERLGTAHGAGGAPILVLATDGEPTSCVTARAREESVEAVASAFAAGMRTFVVSVGTEITAAHLRDLADAGAGLRPGDGGAEVWVATEAAAFERALDGAARTAIGCRAELSRAIDPARACDLDVRAGGEPVACGGRDGFRLAGPTTLELAGATCARVRDGEVTVTVLVPCGAIAR